MRAILSLSAALLLVALLAVLGRLAMPVSTPAFRTPDGQPQPLSVATMERMNINGVAQSLVIRGRDRRNPILIWVHGGPGTSETAALRHFDAALEDHFVVVYWDQRYAGRNFDPLAPKPAFLTIQQYVDDLGGVVDAMLARFGRKKVVVLAHSWGTVPAVLYAQQHPDKLFAYVGVGQVANVPESERRSYAWALSEAEARHDRRAESDLKQLGPPPRSGGLIFTPRKWLMAYGGSFHGDLDYTKLILASMSEREANWRDVAAFVWAPAYTASLVQGEFSRFVIDNRPRVFAAPVFILSGRYDHQSEASVSRHFYDQVQAPRKAFVWFEQSSHNPPFEEPAAFQDWIVKTILPLTESPADCSSLGRMPAHIRP